MLSFQAQFPWTVCVTLSTTMMLTANLKSSLLLFQIVTFIKNIAQTATPYMGKN